MWNFRAPRPSQETVIVLVLAVAVCGAVAGGCAAEGPTRLTVTFQITAEEVSLGYDVNCASATASVPDPQPVCARILERREVLFPTPGYACSLPAHALYVDVSGRYVGEKLNLTIAPCTDVEDRALREWVALLRFDASALYASFSRTS